MAFKGIFTIPALPGAMEWEAIGQLRNVSILRIGYLGVVLIPTLARLIIEWNKFVPAMHISLPISLFLAFLGSTFLATGHLLNEVLCPKLIKFYGTFQRYQQNMAEFIKNEDLIFQAGAATDLRIISDKLKESYGDELGDGVEAIAKAIENRVSERRQTLTTDAPPVTDYKVEWNSANTKGFCVRVFIVICYIVAALIAIYLAFTQLYSVFFAALA